MSPDDCVITSFIPYMASLRPPSGCAAGRFAGFGLFFFLKGLFNALFLPLGLDFHLYE